MPGPNIGEVTVGINVETRGLAQALRQTMMLQREAELLAEKASDAAAKFQRSAQLVANADWGIGAAREAISSLEGDIDRLQGKIKQAVLEAAQTDIAIGQLEGVAADYGATLEAFEKETSILNRLRRAVASEAVDIYGEEGLARLRAELDETERIYERTRQTVEDTNSQIKTLTETSEEQTEVVKTLRQELERKVAAQEKEAARIEEYQSARRTLKRDELAAINSAQAAERASLAVSRAYGVQSKAVGVNTRSMSRFARILNVLRHPRYLLTIEGMTFAFREMAGAADDAVNAFRRLPILVRGAIGVFGALAAILIGGVVFAFKAATGETAKLVDQMNLLQLRFQNITGQSRMPAWMEEFARATRSSREEVGMLLTDMQLMFEGMGVGNAGALTRQVADLAEGLRALRPGIDVGEALRAAQGVATGDISGLGAFGINPRLIEREWRRIARAQGTSVEFLTRAQREQAALRVVTQLYGDDLEEAKQRMEAMPATAEDVRRAIEEWKQPSEEVKEAQGELNQAVIDLVSMSGSVKQFWDSFRAGALGALTDAVRMVDYLFNLIETGIIELGDRWRDQPWFEPTAELFGFDPNAGRDSTGELQALAAIRRRMRTEGRLDIVDAAALQIQESINEEWALSETVLRDMGERLVLTEREMADFLRTVDLLNRQGKILLTAEEQRTVNTLWREFEVLAQDAARAAKEAGDANEEAADGFTAIGKAINDTNQAFGLINSWKGFVESFKQAQQDPSAENVLRFWQQYRQFVLQAAEQGSVGIERLRSDIEMFAKMGVDPKILEMMNRIIDDTITAVNQADLEGNALVRGLENAEGAAGQFETAVDKAMATTVSSGNEVIEVIQDIPRAFFDAKGRIESNPIIISARWDAFAPAAVGPRYGVYATQPGGGGTGSPSWRQSSRTPSRAVDHESRAMNRAIDAMGINVDAVVKGLDDFTSDIQESTKSLSTTGLADLNNLWGGGGGGGGGGRAASIEDIRKLIQEVNRAIRIGIRGGVDVGFEGNVIPAALGPDEYLTAEGGGLAINTLIIKGVWDFSDPAAKRKIIRELEEALRNLKAEV